MSTPTASPVAENATALAVAKLLSSALLFAWQVVLARRLGAAAYGTYGAIAAVMAVVAAVPDAGIGTIFVRDVAHDRSRLGRYLAAALRLHAVLAVAAYGIAQAAAWALGYDVEVRTLLAFVAINLLIDALGTIGHNALVAQERMVPTALISTAHAAVIVGLGGLALWVSGRLWAVYGALGVAGVFRTITYWWALRRRGMTPDRQADRRVARHLLAEGAPLGAAALFTLALMHADRLAVAAMAGPAATGAFMAAFVLIYGIVDLIGSTTLSATLPALARQDAAARAEVAPRLLQELVHIYFLCGAPLVVLGVLLGPALVQRLLGPTFGEAGAVLQVLAGCLLTRPIEGAVAQVLVVRGRATTVLALRAVGLTLNLAVTLTLLPRIGVIGAAAGAVAGEAAIIGAALGTLSLSAGWWHALAARGMRLSGPLAALLVVTLVARAQTTPVVAMIVGVTVYAGLAGSAGAVTAEQWATMRGVHVRGMRAVQAWRESRD